jgi:magnesium transporter
MTKEAQDASMVGLPPGTAVHVGRRRTEEVRITVVQYNADELDEREVASVEECLAAPDGSHVTWINVDGIHQVDVIERLGVHCGLHPLVVEDIVNTDQRPKLEDYEDYLYLVLKMLSYDAGSGTVQAEHVSIILGRHYVLSFQERPGDVFDPVRERIRASRGRIRNMGADYLVYSLVDAMVDSYFVICEAFEGALEDLDARAMGDPSPATARSIHRVKGEIILLRKSLWPLREIISGLQRGESPLIADTTQIYLRDVYDHTIQVIDTIESFRDVAGGMLDIYLSSLSNRMNEVMKVLTMIATVFIPLTFIAGIYGMNFQHMPELAWRYSYPAVWGIMGAVTVGMVLFFRRRGWL